MVWNTTQKVQALAVIGFAVVVYVIAYGRKMRRIARNTQEIKVRIHSLA